MPTIRKLLVCKPNSSYHNGNFSFWTIYLLESVEQYWSFLKIVHLCRVRIQAISNLMWLIFSILPTSLDTVGIIVWLMGMIILINDMYSWFASKFGVYNTFFQFDKYQSYKIWRTDKAQLRHIFGNNSVTLNWLNGFEQSSLSLKNGVSRSILRSKNFTSIVFV